MLGRINPSVIYAVMAATLFGISAPVAKLLLGKVQPLPLAALVYLGSGCVLLIIRTVALVYRKPDRQPQEASVSGNDIPWLAGAVLVGGVVAPISLMLGLNHTTAATASLLLNFEGASTALVAAVVFKEAVGQRVWLAIGCITIASVFLSLEPGAVWGISIGAVGVLAACLSWGFDNNFTRNISGKDPLLIVMIKGLVAGSFSLVLALVTHAPLPSLGVAIVAMLFGSVSYGLSIVLFILALRGLGAARTGAFFGTAPFLGALVSVIIFRLVPDWRTFVSLPFMIAGVAFLLSEQHEHSHTHEAAEHEHRHTHSDSHHGHDHTDKATDSSHSHRHTHKQTQHSHPHTPDDHHRHSH